MTMSSASFNLEKIRAVYPALHQTRESSYPVFLDGPGGMQVPQVVGDAMVDYLLHSNSNLLNSPFFAVQNTHQLVADARQKAAAFVNADSPNSMVFGQSMSAITAHFSRSLARKWQTGDEIIVTALDHYSNVSFWQMAAADAGITCHQARVESSTATLDVEHMLSLINENTKLIAFTLASNVSGSRIDPAPIIAAAKKVGSLTYVDSVHAAPHFLPDVQAVDCDFLACSAYKFGGPHLGFLYGREALLNRLTPYKVEPAPSTAPESWETGTKSFEALAGFCALIDFMAAHSPGKNLRQSLENYYAALHEHETSLTTYFLEQAATIDGLKIYGHQTPQNRTATFAFTLADKASLEVSTALAKANISTGSGHFYAKGLIEALNLAEQGGVLRAGCVAYTTKEELNRMFEVLKTLA